ncbi:helix-turn-helix domain-containing protein [Mitsuokella sp.]|uniref:helix-turn-helix domain-containing protein n=1 Tax=Mitsuokella sp. TaxID=2049034 RepID=UPI003D7F101F
MKTPAEKLKMLRESKGMSQEDCAKALGIDRTTYVKYENGGSIKRNVEKLARFFQVSTDYLLGRTDTPNEVEPISKVVKGDPVSEIFDDSDLRSLARRNFAGMSSQEADAKKKNIKRVVRALFDDDDDE